MCSPTCIDFVKSHLLQQEIRGKRVIEVGSLDVNGTPRQVINNLQPLSYLGVDITSGSGVDVICDVNGLVKRFGKNSFDVVVSTELIEHVRNWRDAVSNLKNVLKPDGLLLLTTRSKGFYYHGYPFDFWRYEIEDMRVIFSDLSIETIETDPRMPGVFLKAQKPDPFRETNLKVHNLYSVVTGKRCRNIHSFEVLYFRLLRWSERSFMAEILPAKVKRIIKKVFWRKPI